MTATLTLDTPTQHTHAPEETGYEKPEKKLQFWLKRLSPEDRKLAMLAAHSDWQLDIKRGHTARQLIKPGLTEKKRAKLLEKRETPLHHEVEFTRLLAESNTDSVRDHFSEIIEKQRAERSLNAAHR